MIFGKKKEYETDGWKFETAIGECQTINGFDIFAAEWKSTGEKVEVTDPHYGQKHTFKVYTIDADGKTYEFAAGEFSNSVWGFYTRKK